MNGDKVKEIGPHLYAPDLQAMGDCRECGHVAGFHLHVSPEMLGYLAAVKDAASKIVFCGECDCPTRSQSYIMALAPVSEQEYRQQRKMARVDTSFAKQLSDSMALNSKYAIAIKATIDDLERRMSAENSSIIDRLRAVLR